MSRPSGRAALVAAPPPAAVQAVQVASGHAPDPAALVQVEGYV